jgi:hypothetical protein
MPVSFPLRAGMTLPTALAAPVEAGIMFWFAPRPSRHSYQHKNKTVKGMHEITQWWCQGSHEIQIWYHKGYDVTLFFSNIKFSCCNIEDIMKVQAKKCAYTNCNFSNKNTCCEFKHGHWKEAQGRQLSLSSNMLVYIQELHPTVHHSNFYISQFFKLLCI